MPVLKKNYRGPFTLSLLFERISGAYTLGVYVNGSTLFHVLSVLLRLRMEATAAQSIWVLVCSLAPPAIRYVHQWIQSSSPMTKSFACTLEHLPSARRISAWSLPDHSSCSHHSSSRDICHHDFGVTDLPPARPFLLTVCFAAPFSPFPPSGRT